MRIRFLLPGTPDQDEGFHRQKPDTDNLVKGVLDALAEEDKAIHTIFADKIWTAGATGIWICRLDGGRLGILDGDRYFSAPTGSPRDAN